ncbi:hypothetical protein [Daejeonella lutea]|uniref:Outer membrane protein beta-barrel domain-containing protein n=1 Tax=Daejeonella lutea TaxID=572036 RepID=A0A1T5ERR2_9SPHI|nr:hypothetical protein [Daejeonella lutea]SKB86621.1 hypothetical protein SAMN05661099_3165 [Daejeonella lutea]
MNNTNQNHTDNFFRQALNSPPEFKASEKNWNEMERLLRKGSKRKTAAWIYPLSGIAAALLIFLSLWLAPTMNDKEISEPQSVKNVGKNAGKITNSTVNSADPTNTEASSKPITDITDPSKETLAEFKNTKTQNSANSLDLGTSQKLGIAKFTLRNNLPPASRLLHPHEIAAEFAGINPSITSTVSSQSATEISKPSDGLTNGPENSEKPVFRPTSFPTGRWALSLALSPDVNSVKGIEKGDLGLSMGIGVSYRLGKRMSAGTGIYYSKKLYSADKMSYKTIEKPFATWTSYSRQIDADCRVLDIPLNINLMVSSKAVNKIYATAGMSSYIMLSEKYDFIYNAPSPAFPTGRREYTIRNENKHLLSVVNLGLALEHPLSNQVSLVIQPYAKLPLTGIGQGETDLKSFGVGFKLNYSIKKP